MTGLALQVAMAGAVTVQAPASRGCIRIGSEACVIPGFKGTISIDGHCLPFTVVMAGLASGHVEPAVTGGVAYRRHRAVAGLALHDVLAGCVHRIAHGTTQTLGILARMAIEAGIAGTDAVQGLA